MSKYNPYNNELTQYIKRIVKIPIHDIVGSITGDILNVDIPTNIPDGDIEINAMTTLGTMYIKINISQGIITFTRKISDSIIENYYLELDSLFISNVIKGQILEIREKGIILTNIIREYDFCNHDDTDMRLINSLEKRKTFSIDQLEKTVPNLCLTSYSFEQKCAIIEKLMDYLKNLEEISEAKGVKPLINASIRLSIPGYIGINNRVDEYPPQKEVVINNESPILLYEFIVGNKTLERINALLHGYLSSDCMEDFKTMCEHSSNTGFKNYMPGFNRLATYMTSTSSGTFSNQLSILESELIGQSKVELPKQYYEYLKELISEYFNIKVTDEPTPDIIVQLIKSYGGE